MRLVIDGYGKYLGKEGNLIVVKEKGKVVKKANVQELRQVILSGKASISTDAIDLLLKYSVDAIFVNYRGEVTGRLSHPFVGMAITRREQYMAYNDKRAVTLAVEFTKSKIKNQLAVLSNLAKTRKDSSPEIADYIMEKRSEVKKGGLDLIERLKCRNIELCRERILGIEGEASKHYWSALAMIFPDEYGFRGRRGLDEKHSRYAQDIINAMLNYGYAILHSECVRALELAGLDPYAGFLHSDRSGRTSLALDLMEEFRQQIVDRSVVKLVSYKQVKPDDCEMENFVCTLKDNARKGILREVLQRLENTTQYQGRNVRYAHIIQSQARKVTKFIRGEQKYSGFWQRW